MSPISSLQTGLADNVLALIRQENRIFLWIAAVIIGGAAVTIIGTYAGRLAARIRGRIGQSK